jgi:hypothetical protein
LSDAAPGGRLWFPQVSAGALDSITVDNFVDFNLLLSIVALNISLVYMKYFLSTNGIKVNWLWGWGRDFRILRRICRTNATSTLIRDKAKKIMYSIYFSIGYLIATGVFGVVFSR